MQPTECKYCGCEEVATKTDSEIVFRCWSSYVVEDDHWTVSNNCGARCAVQLVELKEQVQRAIEVMEGGDRIMMMLDDDDEDVSFVVPATDVDRAVGILGGEEDDDINSSKSSNGSPVTTDDLATEDYFEAVRQQVPWMVAVEHIDGLVEGYRRCGLMVWKAAKHIEDLFGGEHGKAD